MYFITYTFLYFFNGLAEEIKKVGGVELGKVGGGGGGGDTFLLRLLLFADDIVLIAPDKKTLQRMLDVVNRYSKKYRFCFNTDKSNIMIFGSNEKEKFLFR